MANKRMFTMKIVDSDAFLDMPLSSQCLYFHLNMRADDDGFIGNVKKIMRIVGASEDDLKLLIAKRFLLVFENGVIVIKHWRMHNTLTKNRYRETAYTDEKSCLKIKENNSYSLTSGNPIDDSKLIETFQRKTSGEQVENKWRTSGEQMADSDLDLDKDLDKDIIIVSKDTICQTDIRQIMEEWNKLSKFGIKQVSRLNKSSKRFEMLVARIKQYGKDDILTAIEKIKQSDYCQGKNKYNWAITFDWFVRPNNFPKVLDGNYDNRSGGINDGQTNRTTKTYNDRIIPDTIWDDTQGDNLF